MSDRRDSIHGLGEEPRREQEAVMLRLEEDACAMGRPAASRGRGPRAVMGEAAFRRDAGGDYPAAVQAPARLVARRACEELGADAYAQGLSPEVAVQRASASSGAPLPAAIQRRFEGSLGVSLEGVRVHTGVESATAAQAVRARAYTTGQDIHFAAGRYDPASTEGARLLAHEVAHTVQQAGAGAAGPQCKLEITAPGDASEVEADVAAEAMLRGAPAAVGAHAGLARRALQRDPDETIEMSTTFVEGGGSLSPGDAGFSRRMLEETGARAEANFENITPYLLTPLNPRFASLEEDIALRAQEVADAQSYCDSAPLGCRGISLEVSNERIQLAQAHLNLLNAQQTEEQDLFNRYNAWVPFANGFIRSCLRLQEQMNMSGVPSLDALAQQLTAGLSDAQEVAPRAQQAQDHGGEALRAPPADATVTQAATAANQAYAEMNTAWLGLQQNALRERAQQVSAEGQGDVQRLEEIEATRRAIAGIIDTAEVALDGALGEVVLLSSALDEDEPRDPSVVGAAADPGTAVDGVASAQLDYSEPLANLLTDVLYGRELVEIKHRLRAIQARVDAISSVQELLEIQQKAEVFQNSVTAFSAQCSAYQRRLAQRRQDYLDFGVQLDNFARGDRRTRRAGQAPEREQERYAQIMTLTASVREALAMGRSAKDAFASPDELATWRQQFRAARLERPSLTFVQLDRRDMGQEEMDAIVELGRQTAGFHALVNGFEQEVGPIDSQAADLMGALHQGGGTGEY